VIVPSGPEDGDRATAPATVVIADGARENRIEALGPEDAGDPGLADGLAAATTLVDGGPGGDVEVIFARGSRLVVAGAGTGSNESLAEPTDAVPFEAESSR
jgi:hypothetical protein